MPALTDLDGDGETDMVLADFFNGLRLFENTLPRGDLTAIALIIEDDLANVTGPTTAATTLFENSSVLLDLSGLALVNPDGGAFGTALVLTADRGRRSAAADQRSQGPEWAP